MVFLEEVLQGLVLSLLFRQLVAVPVRSLLNGTLVEELQDKTQTMCDISPTSSCKRGWDYGKELGPEHWPGVCVTGKHQSPVNLDEEEVKTAAWESLAFYNYNKPGPLKVTNNGHSIFMQVSESCPRGIGAGGLPGPYYLFALHFHWNSEHMLSGKKMPLEVHFVHLKSKYSTVDEARKDPEGLAYLAVFFEETGVENVDLKPLVEAIKGVADAPDTSVDVEEFSLTSLLPYSTDVFYRYHGSLTTPDCDEIVVWTVLKNTVPISTSQLEAFHNVKDFLKRKRSTNRRPVQSLNDRTMYLRSSGNSRVFMQVLLLVALFLHV